MSSKRAMEVDTTLLGLSDSTLRRTVWSEPFMESVIPFGTAWLSGASTEVRARLTDSSEHATVIAAETLNGTSAL